MFKTWKIKLLVLAITGLIAAGLMVGTATAQKQSTPKTQDKAALAQENARQLLLLMGKDKNGKITKQEFMKFMEEEFDRLDKDKSGDLDVRDLAESRLAVNPAVVGK